MEIISHQLYFVLFFSNLSGFSLEPLSNDDEYKYNYTIISSNTVLREKKNLILRSIYIVKSKAVMHYNLRCVLLWQLHVFDNHPPYFGTGNKPR